MLMRGNTPPTIRSPPHQSRQTENPPNQQPATVCEEERGGRDQTSRQTPMRAAPDCRPPPTARHASQPSSRAPATHPSNKTQSTGSCAPARGRGPEPAQDCCAAPHGRLRAPTGPVPPADRPAAAAPHDTIPANNNRPEEMRTSCRQQPAPPSSMPLSLPCLRWLYVLLMIVQLLSSSVHVVNP